MRGGLSALAVLAAVGLAGGAEASDPGAAGPRQVYCYAFGMADGDKLVRLVTRRTLFVSPVFATTRDDVALEVAYRRAIPDAGLATCVSEEYEPDVPAAWEQFVTLSREDGTPLVIVPLPED